MRRPALLFDLDGTLLDSDPLHAAVFVELMAEHGVAFSQADYAKRVHGRLNADVFAELLPGANAQALSQEKEARFRARLAAGTPPGPTPGAPGLIARARARGWGLAVVTNAMRPNADAMLAALGLADAFDTLVIGEECARAKPHPDPYAIAMARLSADPARSLAFEASPAGIASARAAGAVVAGLRSSLDDAALRAAGAHLSIADFTDPALAPHLARLQGAAA